jgi:molecular chaperone GrpE
VATDPEKPDGAEPEREGFDAIAAAEELAASLGLGGSDRDAGDQAYTATLEREIEQLNLLLDEKDVEISRLSAALERSGAAREAAQGEIGKASARIEREQAKRQEQRLRDILLHFIEINDDLDRAIDTASTTPQAEKILEGVELVQRSFVKKLADLGVAPFNPKGEPFDPEMHEALAAMATADPDEDGVVLEVIRIGYTIGDECLRPARVAVGKLAS